MNIIYQLLKQAHLKILLRQGLQGLIYNKVHNKLLGASQAHSSFLKQNTTANARIYFLTKM
jgi:hypothetical protein